VSDWITWVLIGVVVIGSIVVYLSSTAGRLDRLHHRIETAFAALDAQLLRRSAAAQDLASSGFLDPASSLLLSSAAQGTLVANPLEADVRAAAESELTRAINAVFDDADMVDEIRDEAHPDEVLADQLLTELALACRRTEFARRFHNDVVRSCTQLRRKRVCLWFRLAGHTPMPSTIDFDDSPPPTLAEL
jgi:hypothetical protein